jgi:hypothetical protein
MKSILTPSLYLSFKIYLRSGGEAALRLSAPTYNMPTWHFLLL